MVDREARRVGDALRQVRTADTESVELGPGGLVRFEPAERHSLSSSGGARILIVLTPWPGAGHYPAD